MKNFLLLQTDQKQLFHIGKAGRKVMRIKSQETRKWIVPLVSGIVCVLIGWAAYRHFNPPLLPNIVKNAQAYGMSPQEFNHINEVLKVGEETGDISEGDWQNVQRWLQSPHDHIRQRALGIMAQMQKSPRRDEILSLAKPYLQSDKPELILVALNVVYYQHDPAWREVALRNRQHPNQYLRDVAERLLTKDEKRTP